MVLHRPDFQHLMCAGCGEYVTVQVSDAVEQVRTRLDLFYDDTPRIERLNALLRPSAPACRDCFYAAIITTGIDECAAFHEHYAIVGGMKHVNRG